MRLFVFCLVLFSTVSFISTVSPNNGDDPTPVVLWHGMGDNCCSPFSMGYVAKLIKSNIPQVYVRSLMLGKNVLEDIQYGFFANMNKEVEEICDAIQNDEKLRDGYNLIGFSQGGLFARALAQRCPNPPVRNLISLGGPQQGIFGLPLCPAEDTICNTVRRLLDYGAYNSFVQRNSVQAQYWHDPRQGDGYRNRSIFLADLNCERGCNTSYRENMLRLKNFVLIKFTRDQMIVPKESSWFGFFNESDISMVLSMEQTDLYQEDLIGLKALKETGRLQFIEINGLHLEISASEFVSKIIKKYLIEEKFNNELLFDF